MMKIVKFNNQGCGETIEVFESSEIQREFNAYGYYYIDEDFEQNLSEYRLERNEHIKDLFEGEEPAFSEIKEAISDFKEDYCFESSKGSESGRPSKFIQSDDEEYVSSLEGYYDEPNGVEMDDEGAIDYNEYVSWWDGSNFKKIYLHSEMGWTDTEDITDERLESFNRKEFIGSDKGINSTRWNEYYYDKEDGVIWGKNVTCWQGERKSWFLIEDEESIDVCFVEYADEKIDELRKNIRERHGENLDTLRLEVHECGSCEEFSLCDLFEIFSMDNYESLGTWVNDPYKRTCGGEYFKHKKTSEIISYYWSAYQGDWRGYSHCNLSEKEIMEKL